MQKPALFGGMFKKSTKSAEPLLQAQDSLSVSSELSQSSDSLTDSSTKEKGGLFKGVFKKTSKAAKDRQPEASLSIQHPELSVSSDSLTDNKSSKEKSGVFGGRLKRSPKLGHVRTPSQDLLDTEFTASNDSLSESSTTKEKGGVFSGMFKKYPKPFGARTLSQEGLSAASDPSGSSKPEKPTSSDDEDPPDNKQKDAEDTETLKENEKRREEPGKPAKGSILQRERKDRSETPAVPSRPTEEEMKRTSTNNRVEAREAVADQHNEDMISRSSRPSEESRPDDRGLTDESAEAKEGDKIKVKKPKRHNPFMPNAGAKAQSDEEELEEEEDSSSKDEEGEDKTLTKVKKPKRLNPFMPRKGKATQRNAQDGAAENEGGNRTLFDRLEDLRIDPSQPDDRRDADNLMEWWNNVESWEDTLQEDDMTEKEEAKAFAVTADKVQKGIRVFNKLFSERGESLWQHIMDLNSIADGLDKFNKNTKIARITGGSTSAIGGVATITGLALAPFTMGISLIVTAVGLGVATAGGLTSAGASISNQVNNSMDRKKVEKIVQDYQEQMVDLNKCLQFVKRGIENLKRFDLIKMKKQVYNRDFRVLSSSFYEDGAMAGKAILVNANEIMRVVQIANVAGSTAARAVQIASMAPGVLTGLFVGMDIYFVAKDSKELKKGAKSEFAAKIREVVAQLHDGLVELNGIREELQTNSPDADPAASIGNGGGKEKEDKHDGSSEDGCFNGFKV